MPGNADEAAAGTEDAGFGNGLGNIAARTPQTSSSALSERGKAGVVASVAAATAPGADGVATEAAAHVDAAVVLVSGVAPPVLSAGRPALSAAVYNCTAR